MSLGLGAILGLGGFGLGSSALSGLFNQAAQNASLKKSYEYSKDLLRLQQSWAQKMANTAHQREVADLRAAGLNPILTTGGSGASTPVVSAPTVSGHNGTFDLASGFMDGVNTGVNAAKIDSAIQSLDAQTALDRAKVDTEVSQQKLNDSLAAEAAAKTKEINSGLPLNRIPGSALRMSDVFSFIPTFAKESLGYFKDLYEGRQIERRLNDMQNNKPSYRFSIEPAGEIFPHSAK